MVTRFWVILVDGCLNQAMSAASHRLGNHRLQTIGGMVAAASTGGEAMILQNSESGPKSTKYSESEADSIDEVPVTERAASF